MSCVYCDKIPADGSLHLLPDLLVKFSNKHLKSDFTVIF